MKTIVGVKRGIMLKLEKDKQKIEAKYREKIVKLGFHKESQIIDEVKYIIYIEKQDVYRESKFLPWKPKNKKNKKKINIRNYYRRKSYRYIQISRKTMVLIINRREISDKLQEVPIDLRNKYNMFIQE